MTYNYNSTVFTDKNSEEFKLNDEVMVAITTNRCNNCIYLNFGARKCNKKNENGNLVRPNMIPVTYTEPTNRGHFIHIIKPFDCHDFTPKVKQVAKEKR